MPTSAASASGARFGVPAMPPKATRADAMRRPSSVNLKAPRHGRDILVEALRHLVGAEILIGFQLRHDDARERYSPGCRSCLPIGDEEAFQRDRPHALATAQFELRAERDQRRREIADGRSIGDVAADGAGGAHLHGAKAPHDFAEIGIDRRQTPRSASAWLTMAPIDERVRAILDLVAARRPGRAR